MFCSALGDRLAGQAHADEILVGDGLTYSLRHINNQCDPSARKLIACECDGIWFLGKVSNLTIDASTAGHCLVAAFSLKWLIVSVVGAVVQLSPWAADTHCS